MSYTGIVRRPSGYIKTVEPAAIEKSKLPSELVSHVEKWKEGGSNDQICLTRVTERGVEVVPTQITGKLLIDIVSGGDVDEDLMKEFLEQAIDCDCGFFDDIDALRNVCKVILESGDLELAKILVANDFEILLAIKGDVNLRNLLLALVDNPDLLKVNDRNLLVKLFSKNLIENPDLTEEHKLFVQLLGYVDPSDVLKLLKEKSDLLKDTELSSLILKSKDPLSILKGLEEYFDLSDREVLINMLRQPNCLGILKALERHPELHKDHKLFEKIVHSKDPYGVLMALDRHHELLQDHELLFKILSSENSSGILDVLGRSSELLTEKYRDLLIQIFASENPSGILDALGRSSELLTEKYRGLLLQILRSENPSGILDVLVRNTSLFGDERRDLLEQILGYQNPAAILKILNKNSILLEESHRKLLMQIFSFQNPLAILTALEETPRFLEEEYRESLKQILVTKNPSPILEALGSYPQILDNPQQFEEVLLAPDPIAKTKNLYYGQFVTISPDGYRRFEGDRSVHINQNLFINDPTINKWNILTQRDGYISDKEWELINNELVDIFDGVFEEREMTKNNMIKFLSQCMATSTTDSDVSHQVIKKRVEAVVKVLSMYFKELNNPLTSTDRKKELKEIIQQALNKMAMGGRSCPDLAIVCLREAETHLKLFAYPQYIANIFVNMYKIYEIDDKLIDKDYNESVESLLNYTIQFNNILGLGIMGGMLYQNLAEKIPLDQALKILSDAFTEKALIDYTAELPEFRLLFEKEKESVYAQKKEELGDAIYELMELRDDFNSLSSEQKIAAYGTISADLYMSNNPDCIKQQALVNQYEEKLKQLQKAFYGDKARQIFLDAGFFFEA